LPRDFKAAKPRVPVPKSRVTSLSATFAGRERVPCMSEKSAQEFGTANNIEVALYDAHNNVDVLKATLASISPPIPDVLIVLNDPFMFVHMKIIVGAAQKLQLPAIYGFREFVDAGGLISYGPSIRGTYRRAAGYVDKILTGTKVADLPVVLPTKFELVINLTTAKAVGLTIPASLMSLADELIE